MKKGRPSKITKSTYKNGGIRVEREKTKKKVLTTNCADHEKKKIKDCTWGGVKHSRERVQHLGQFIKKGTKTVSPGQPIQKKKKIFPTHTSKE